MNSVMSWRLEDMNHAGCRTAIQCTMHLVCAVDCGLLILLNSCLTTQVAKLKQTSIQSKADKKAEKKANKEAKKAKKRAASQMEAALAAPGVGPQSTNGNGMVAVRPSSDNGHADRHRQSHREPRYQDSYKHDRDSSYQRDAYDDAQARKCRRVSSPERHDRHRTSSHAHEDDYRDRHHAGKGNRRQHDSHSHRHDDYSNRHHDSKDDRQQHSRRVQSEAAEERPKSHANGEANGHANGHAQRHGSKPDSRDGTKYGLSWGDSAPQELQSRDR